MKARIPAALAAVILGLVSTQPAAAAEDKIQKADRQIEDCLAEARKQAPDLTDHGKRLMAANRCICEKVKDLCQGGMIQDPLLRQRLLEDK